MELCVTHVVKPRGHWYSIVRMEDIGGWRVIQNEHPPKVSAQTAQVLHVVPPVEDTRLPEQTCPEGPPLVQQVSHWVCILGEAGGEQHTLEKLAHSLQELIHMGPLQHVDLVDHPINLHRDDEVGVVHWLEGAVHQGLVQVDDHADLVRVLGLGLGEQVLDWSLGDSTILLHKQGSPTVGRHGLRIITADTAEK